MPAMDLCFTPASRLAALIRQRKVSPLEVTQAVLAQIERVNAKVNAYCTVAAKTALADARKATSAVTRRSARLGPLHGVPVSIKDLTPTRGIRTTWGSKIYEHDVPTEDGLVVERLRAAGAIVIGKTNTPEFGAGGNTRNAVFGPTLNPWNLALTCGGSTGGGAVALATGMAPLAQGSDLGGSLRIPASFCGVVGLRPSPGLVPVWPHPLACAVDTRAFTAAVKRPSARGLRIAWGGDLGVTPVDDEVLGIARNAMAVFRKVGARISDEHPDLDGVNDVVLISRGARMVGLHEEKLAKWRDVMQEHLVRNIDDGLELTAADIGRCERQRSVLSSRFREFFGRHDVIATPTTAVPPFPVEAWYLTKINGQPVANYISWVMLTYAFTVVGLPAISIPCGFTRDGLPVGLQLAGPWRDEATVLRAAAAFESAAPWADRRPPVVA